MNEFINFPIIYSMTIIWLRDYDYYMTIISKSSYRDLFFQKLVELFVGLFVSVFLLIFFLSLCDNIIWAQQHRHSKMPDA